MTKTATIILFLAVFLLGNTEPALAYIGPGLGLGAIGAIVGVVASVLLAIFAILWYPIKRMLGIGKVAKSQPGESKTNK